MPKIDCNLPKYHHLLQISFSIMKDEQVNVCDSIKELEKFLLTDYIEYKEAFEVVKAEVAVYELPAMRTGCVRLSSLVRYTFKSIIFSTLARLNYQTLDYASIDGRARSAVPGEPREEGVLLLLNFRRYFDREIFFPIRRVSQESGISTRSTSLSTGVSYLTLIINGLIRFPLQIGALFGSLVKFYTRKSIFTALSVKLSAYLCGNFNIDRYVIWCFLYLRLIPLLRETDRELRRLSKLISFKSIMDIAHCNDADPLVRLVLLLARKRNIPSYCIQFGNISEEAIEWRYTVSDYFFLWGSGHKSLLLSMGLDASRLLVAGSPRYDEVSRRVNVRPVAPSRPVNARERTWNVLFLSTCTTGTEVGNCFQSALAQAKMDVIHVFGSSASCHLTVKLHPLEKEDSFSRLDNSLLSGVSVLAGDVDATVVVEKADLIITFGSTLTMHALVLGIPVLYLCYPGIVWWTDCYLESDVVYRVRDRSTLEACERSLASFVFGDPSRRDRIKDFLQTHIVLPPDGAANEILRGIVHRRRVV